ncbi:MAG: peptidyl-prolyl cis-trans isomerase [Pseudorhodoplanes sp.]
MLDLQTVVLQVNPMSEKHKSVSIATPAAGVEPGTGPLERLWREPLLHFLLIGAAVFGLYALVAPSAVPASNEIVITAADAGRLKARFRGAWNREPTAAEFNGLLDNLIREEVYYREAKALGLDQNDEVIRLRLRQKAEYLFSQAGSVTAPTEAQLRAHYEVTRDKYVAPSTISFEQIFLGEPQKEEFERMRKALEGGAEASTLGTASLLPGKLTASHQAGVDTTFGKGFFALISAAPLGVWTGPVKSSYGQHMIRVIALTRSDTLPFEQVRQLVETDWRTAEGERAKEDAYLAMKARYRIDLSQIDRP